jgi:hypothetical protein
MDKVSAILWPKGDADKHRQLHAQNDASAILERVDRRRAVLLGMLSFGDAEIAGLKSTYQMSGSNAIGIAQSIVSQLLAETGTSGSSLYIVPETSLPYVLSYIRSAGVTAQTAANGSGYVVLRVASSSSTEVDPKLAESVLIWPAVGGETICIQANPVLSASFLPAVGGVDLTITPIASGYYELHAMAENTMTLGGFISDAVYSIPVKLLDNVTIEIGPSDVLSACGMPTLLEEIDITLCGKTMEGYRTFANGNDVIDLQGNGRGVLSLYAVGDWSASVLAGLIDSKTISSTRGMQCETEIGSAIRNSVIVAWAPLSQYDHSFVSDMDSIALKDLERVVIE